MGNRELAVKWAAQSQAEQFFRTPSGFLKAVNFDSSEEDKAKFCNLLGRVGRYATWDDDRAISDQWYAMVVKVADERVEIA
jgi:RNA polymerase subunit RPABC4/transcription elongation factor Spt4